MKSNLKINKRVMNRSFKKPKQLQFGFVGKNQKHLKNIWRGNSGWKKKDSKTTFR